MKIAQIAPLAERVPPKLYGGTERVVHALTQELVAQGHEVTLFASGDSMTDARLAPCSETALRLNPSVKDYLPHLLIMLDEIRRRQHEFDILHFHLEIVHFPLIRSFGNRVVTTLHLPIDRPDLRPFYQAFADVAVVSISDAQRQPMPMINWRGTVYHGLPRNALPFTGEPAGGYLAFLGRISPEKGVDRAISIARQAGMPLKIAAKIGDADRPYWEKVIEPLVNSHPDVEFLGEINEHQKAGFLGNARALLFPIDWPEPFGMVMIEAMACGTPVVAFPRGSVPEVIDDGVSGILVKNADIAVEDVARALQLDRRRVRSTFEHRFTAERMARDYVDIYRRLRTPQEDSDPVGKVA